MMNYSSKLLIVVLLIITAGTTASATTYEFNVVGGSQVFACRVSYEVELAYAGNEALKLNVSVETNGAADLESIAFESPDRNKIDFKEDGTHFSTTKETGLRTADYTFFANIRDGVEPKKYSVTIVFKYPGQLPVRHSFPLSIGVRNKGKLNVLTDSLNELQFYTGITNRYKIELENNFQDYPANIRSIAIRSVPSDLVQDTTVQLEDLSIGPLQRRSIPVELKIAPMSFSNLLNGFSESKLILQIAYEDGNGRTITDLEQPVKLRVKPRDRILIVAVFLGVLAGALVKCLWQKLAIWQLDTLKGVLFGLAVAFIALVAKIKIVAFDISGAYDNPAMLAIIGFVAALGGLPILLSIFSKSSNQSSAPAPTNTPNAAAKPAA